MKARRLINACSLLLLLVFSVPAGGGEDPLWASYKTKFIRHDGRIVDYGQEKSSHSEGQGYGLLLALAYDDRETFNRVWKWTKNNLAVRADGLFAWHWGKRHDGNWDVLDYNNATDGDILIAYALLKAGQRWKSGDYTAGGLKIVKALKEELLFIWQGRSLLLPGYKGFVKDKTYTVNPSYFIFPAFRLFAGFDDKKLWNKIYGDSLFILEKASFGKFGLPGDWVKLDKSGISPYTEKSPFFGYGAVRTFLYLSSETGPPFPEGLKKILALYKKIGYLPLMIDIERESVSLKPATAGFYSIYALAARKSGNVRLSKKLLKDAKEKLSKEGNSYYSYTLYLLANNEKVFR
ncbi:MAG: glycosyl hydrolase family 8 [Deltaproteobacteria bacterium]|nr:glycosyl hydrolase family 8 [Deltaproteobacteria bacterium]